MDLISWKFAIFSLCIFFGSAYGSTWCVAKPGASNIDLQHALDYACGKGGVDCAPINPGGSCFTPDTLQRHASYAFNSYYQMHPVPSSCVFGGASTLTNTNPSNGNCHYSSSGSSTSSPGGTTPTTPSGIVYSGTTSTFLSLSMLFACGLLILLQVANFI